MSLYYYIFVVLLINGLYDFCPQKINKNTRLFVVYIVLVTIIGTRVETGTDWIFYEDHYTQLLQNNIVADYSFDVGYEFLASVFAKIGAEYQIFLLLYTACYLGLLFWALKYTESPNLGSFLLYSIYLVGLMGTSRQLMAMGFMSLAFVAISKYKSGMYYMFVIMASLFHKSALIFLLFKNLKPNGKSYGARYLICLFVGALILKLSSQYLYAIFTHMAGFSDLLAGKFNDYSVVDGRMPIFFVDDPISLSLLYARRIFIFLLLCFVYKYNSSNPMLELSLKFYIVGILIFIGLYDFIPAVAVRLGLYFNFFEIFAISSIKKLNKKFSFVVIMYIMISFYTLSNQLLGVDSDLLVPYKSIFINNNLYRELR